MAIVTMPALSTLNDWPQLLDGLRRAEQRLNDWTLNPQAFLTLLGQVFGPAPNPQTPPSGWLDLRQSLIQGKLQPKLEIRNNWEMPGLAGAFQAPTTAWPQGRILLNRQWLAKADAAAIEAVMLEEFGHAIDRQLNGAKDSTGDEGERLSALLRGQTPSTASLKEDDSQDLLIDGQRIRVEGSVITTMPSVTLSLTPPTGSTAPTRTAFGSSTILLDSGLTLGSLGANPTKKVLVVFGRGYVPGEDQLVIVGSLPSTITSSFDAARGILSLIAKDDQTPPSQENWRDALRAVGYNNKKSSLNQTPTAGERELVISTGELPALYIDGQAHFYQYNSAPLSGDSNYWKRAKNAATTSTYGNLTGYLATITSAAENTFISRTLLPSTGRTWLGGSDANNEGKWTWDAGSSSPESSATIFSQTVSGNNTSKASGNQYVNWGAGQGTAGSEDYLSIGNTGLWSDEDAGSSLTKDYGYLIEYSPASGTPDFARRITLNPVATASDQSFAVSDYSIQAVSGAGAQSTYTLTNATIDLGMFGGGTLKIKATSVTISNGKIINLQGSATASGLYGLTDVYLSRININASTRAISGSAKIGGQTINLRGNLKLENSGRYSFADLTESLSNDALTNLLPPGGYLSNVSAGGYGFKKNADGTSLEVNIKGQATFDPRPDVADISTPFTVKLSNGVISNGQLNRIDLQRQGSTPWKLKLADDELTVNSETISYRRDILNPPQGSTDPATIKHLFDIDLTGELKQKQGDTLKLDGVLTYGSSRQGTAPATLLATSGQFDILNNTTFTIGSTSLKTNGGLQLKYQEDKNRKFGVLAANGDAKMTLEVFKDLGISLGSKDINLGEVVNDVENNLRATEWSLGKISTLPTTGKQDLGMVSYDSIDLQPTFSILRNYEPQVEGLSQSEQVLTNTFDQNLGLYKVTSLNKKLSDSFTLKGADGRALATVNLDILPSLTSGNPTLTRNQWLSYKEKDNIYTWAKAKEGTIADFSGIVADLTPTESRNDEIDAKKDYFKSETIQTTNGSVKVESDGKWTYTLKNDEAQKLNNQYVITPSLSFLKPIQATIKGTSLDLRTLAAGEIDNAKLWLENHKTLVDFVNKLEKEIKLTGNKTFDNGLLKLFESTPYNAYIDQKLQAIEIIDTIYYAIAKALFIKRGGDEKNFQGYVPLTPGLKGLGYLVRTKQAFAKLGQSTTSPTSESIYNLLKTNKLSEFGNSEDPFSKKEIILSLNYYGDKATPDSSWQKEAYSISEEKKRENVASKITNPGKVEKSWDRAQTTKKTSGDSEGGTTAPNKSPWKGSTGKSASGSFGFDFNYTYPALFEPDQFITNFLTNNQVVLSTLDLNFSWGVGAQARLQIFPLMAILLGVNANLEWALNSVGMLSQAEIISMNESILRIKNDASLSQAEKEKQLRTLVGNKFDNEYTDLSKQKFKASITPSLALELGLPVLNITGKLGITSQFTYTKERWVDGIKSLDQIVNLKDYEKSVASQRYGYAPKLDSLNFNLEHSYDFLLSQGPNDTTGYQTFKEAYQHNTWLFNFNFEALNLKTLIGESKLSYDISLLKKLGTQSINSIDWVSFIDPSLVTSGGIDFLFKEAKQLNSAVGKAFRSALQKQYQKLTEKEVSRLLSLIIENAIPTKVDYALAESQNIAGRIETMKSTYTITGSRALDENKMLEKDRFRYRFDSNDAENAIDNYQYYNLNTAKYVSINPKLVDCNYISIDFDVISTSDQLDGDIQFFDGKDWQKLGSFKDNLKQNSDENHSRSAITFNTAGPSIDLRFIENNKAKESTDKSTYVHNGGTVSVGLSLARMDDPTSTPLEQALLNQARNGKLQLRLQDTTTSGTGNDTTFMADPRILRGGSYYSKSSEPTTALRQDKPLSWGSHLDFGAVAYVSPTFFRPLPDRPDLDVITTTGQERIAGIGARLNPNLPLATLMGLQRFQASSTTHISNNQSGVMADGVKGSMRFTKDPITQIPYKSYIAPDGRVHIAARLADSSDWVDIATIDNDSTKTGNLNLSANETMAPDLVAVGGDIMVASYDSEGRLLTFTLNKDPDTKRYNISSSTISTTSNAVRLGKQSSNGAEDTNHLSSSDQYDAAASNINLRIGLEKRLDLTSTTSLQQGFYVSVLDATKQTYATSAKALSLDIPDYESVTNTDTLGNLSNGWITRSTGSAALEAQLKSLLGFEEFSTSGVFSGRGNNRSSGNVGTIKAADFIEYNNGDALSKHLAEWGSGSVFVASANANGEAMIWNYDGEAYYGKNKNRQVKESTTSSGRVYTMDGLIPSSLSVVYKPLDQKDSLASNWQGLVDETTSQYQQVSNQAIRTATNPGTDNLIAGGNLAILAVGSAKDYASYHQSSGSSDSVGALDSSSYQYNDGDLITRYISPQRFTGSDGFKYWFDASNTAPMIVESLSTETSNGTRAATAGLNTLGSGGGFGWVWTPANQKENKSLSELNRKTGLDFVDNNSLNLAITTSSPLLAPGQTLKINPYSLQLLPTDLTPEVMLDLGAGSQTLQRLAAKANSLSEMAVVLTGSELVNPGRFQADQKLSSFEVIRSLFNGNRPYLSRGSYIPLGMFRQDGKAYYGNINAPVELTHSLADLQSLYKSPASSYAVVPLGFEGTISDYVSYGVDQGAGSDILKLIEKMPAVVPEGYFNISDSAGNPRDVGKIIHAAMVPLRSSGNKQLILPDLSPWTPNETNNLYVAGSEPIKVSLGRNEPKPVVLEKLNFYATYNGNKTLEDFVNYAWNDVQLKKDLLDPALSVSAFSTPKQWLKEFGTRYGGFDLPTGYSLVSAQSPDLVNNTLFTPVSASADTGNNLDLSGKAPASTDVIRGKWMYETSLNLGAEITALFLTIPIVNWSFPLHDPIVWYKESYGAKKTQSGGPLVGSFSGYLDENRNLVLDPSEARNTSSNQSITLDLSGAGERLLLDTSPISNTVWDGSTYSVLYQDAKADWRSGLMISKPSGEGTVVDVMTGLTNRSTYISRLDKGVNDTNWETIKNSLLLEYIPYIAKDLTSINTGRWFSDRTALTKLVPAEITKVFKTTFLLPTGLDDDLSNPVSVYKSFGDAASAPRPDVLGLYKFETQIMVVSTLIRELYAKLKIKQSELKSSNTSQGYDSEIQAYQLIPHLAFSLAGKTDSHYKTLLGLICDSIGGSRAAQIETGLNNPGSIKLDLSQATDIALVLGFAQTTLPQTDFFTWENGKIKLTESNSIKTALQQMKLLDVATSLSSYLKTWDTISASQFSINPLHVTTAVSEIKREILKEGGVITKAVNGIINKTASGIAAPTAWQTFKAVDATTFSLRNEQILSQAALSKVLPGVAGLAKSQVVNQVYGDNDPGIYEFTLRLSRPAPQGGALLLIGYQGSAVYGSDYTINGLSSRPEYLYIPTGETTQTVTIDASKSKNSSSLLLQLKSSSADYTISTGFNRMLIEMSNGKATIFEQKDNVRLISGDQGQILPIGENLFAVAQDKDPVTKLDPTLIGSQPSLSESYVTVSTYASVLHPEIIQYSTTTPDDLEVTGGWTLQGKNLFRVYEGDSGPVDVIELKNTSSGIYTYITDATKASDLTKQGWVSNGVAFSLDYDRSLPLSIKTARDAAPVGTVPNMSLAGIKGYLDTYTFAPGQDISEWRFVASVKNLSFSNAGNSNITLNGDLMLRKRHEYTTDTFWLNAAASGFVLPTLATGPAANANKASGQLNLRLTQTTGKAAVLDQWRIQTSVTDYQFTNSLKLSGSLDLAYERSAATNNKDRYTLAANVKNFSFSDGGVNLSNLDANLKKLVLDNGELTALNLEAYVKDLKIADQFKVNGKLAVDYNKTATKTTLTGSAEIDSFALNLGDTSSITVSKGSIDFSALNGKLETASLAINSAKISAGEQLTINMASGSVDLVQENGATKSLKVKAALSTSTVGPLSITAANLDLDYEHLGAVPVKNGSPIPARDDLAIDLTQTSGSLKLIGDQSNINFKDATASLHLVNGTVNSYSLSTGSVDVQLGAGINFAGNLSLKKETIQENNKNLDQIFASMFATSLVLDVNDFKLNGSGEVEATIKNQKLNTLTIDANIDSMKYKDFQLAGFAKLQLNDTDNNGSLETIKLSAGIDNFKLNLPGSSDNTSLYGEMQDLVIVNGDIQSWTLIGGIDDLNIANAFTANGFARLSYNKSNEQVSGLIGIKNFSLKLPGNSMGETSNGTANGLLAFDWYDNALHQWKLSAGVKDLKLATGITVTGDVNLEYRDASYATNTYGSDVYLLDATLKEAKFTIQQGKSPITVSGSLKNLAMTNDGVIHSWNLTTSVKNLDLISGITLNGNLNLDYQRKEVNSIVSETFKGWAEVTGFSQPMDGMKTDANSSLSGKLSFNSVDGQLKDWTLSAKATNLVILENKTNNFDGFKINGDVELSTTTSNPSLHTVKANIQTLSFKIANKLDVTMAGQLDLSYKTIDGSIYATEQEWTLKASTFKLSVPNTIDASGGDLFKLDGEANVHYKQTSTDNDFSINAKVNDLTFKLPNNNQEPALKLSGSLDADFDDGDLQRLKINSTVRNLKIKDFTLDGSLELSYLAATASSNKSGEDLFDLHSTFDNVTLKAPSGMANSLILGSGDVDLTYGSVSGLTAWGVNAKVSNMTLFDAITFSGSAGISYEKKTIVPLNMGGATTQEIYDFYVTVTDFTLKAINNQNLKLSGGLKLRSVGGAMDNWSLAASAKGLKWMGLNLDGQFDLAYQKSDLAYYNAETLRVTKASLSSTGISGLLKDSQSSLVISDVLIAKDSLSSDAWTAIHWNAKAELAINNANSPVILKASLDVDYLKHNTKYDNQATYTLNGAVSDFRINSDLISLKNANLTLSDMVVVEGQATPLGFKVQGSIEELSIGKILKLSGDFLIKYVNDTKKEVRIESNLSNLSIAGFDLFNKLGIDSSSVVAIYSGNGDLSADLTIKLAAGAHLKLGEFDLGLGGSDLTLSYSKTAANSSGTLSLAGNGHMTLGSTNIAVEGGFKASINLDTGAPTLDSLSLNLTPNNQPVSFGVFELQDANILYSNGNITLSADTRVNTRFLNQLASPIYNAIDTLSPALGPVVDLLTYQIPNDIKTKEVSITIPAITIPTLEFTGWKTGLFGIKFPTFKTVWKEVSPELKAVVAPAIDIGAPLTRFLENYNGNPYKNNELEVIELIDGFGAAAFYINQKLAQVGFGDAFEPYIDVFGNKAYSMDYPSLAPLIGTIDKLLKLAADGKKTLTQEWLDLPSFDATLNVGNGNLTFNVAGNQDNAFANLASSIGAFGELYSFANRNNPIPSGPTAPQETPGTSSQLGFTDNSSMRMPFLDNPIKSILDFVLDKPLDLFEYNLDITGSLSARASVDLGSWLAAVIGVPIPLILGGNVGLSANLDTTVGFTASTKAIKDIATSVTNLFSNNNTGTFDQVYKAIVSGVTEANRGVYLDISKDILTFNPHASVDLSLDYKVVGLRAQIGVATTLSAALKLLVQPPKLIDIKAYDADTNDGGSSPTTEVVAKAFDGNNGSKYLNFGGRNSGFRITLDKPGNFSTFTIVTGNDAAGRDPTSLTIRARNSNNDPWTTLASNQAITLPTSRNSESAAINFANTGYYNQYEVTFPTLRSASNTSPMQLSEFRFTPKANSTAVNNSRLYLTNLIMPLIDPTFTNGKLANDLSLSLKPGPTTFWLDFLAKVASPWFSVLRLEAGTNGFAIKALGQTIGQTPGLPLPKISLDIPLGTVYTGPTYGPTGLNFANDIVLNSSNATVDLLSDFHSGVADQKGLFDRIGAELASDNPRGFLTVTTSPYSRDVLTAISRSLLLFDAVTDKDPTPDVLNVITSMDSTTALLAAHATTAPAPTLNGSILQRITGFSDEMAGNQSSYALLGASNSAEQSQGLSKLTFEYQLQTVLLAIQDQILSSNGQTAATLQLNGFNNTWPRDVSLWPYILLHQYLAGLPTGTSLDLTNADSLMGLFASIETTLGTTGPSAGGPTAGFLADLVQRLCSRITEIAQVSEALEGSALLAPVALSGVKQLIQSHTLEGYLRDLRQTSGNAQAIQDRSDLLAQSFSTLLTMPRSSATPDRFASLGWAVNGPSGAVSLSLDHASTELGAFVNLWIDSPLIYGVDYQLKGYSNQPSQLVLDPSSDHLDIEIEVLNPSLSGASVNLYLLGSPAGIQIDDNSRVLQVSITGNNATSTVASASQAPLPLNGSTIIHADNQGVFKLSGQSGPPYLLLGFDPLLGHRIDSSATAFGFDDLRIINGLLYAGTKAIGAVRSTTLNGSDLLSYADQLAPSTPDPDAGQTWRTQEQSLQEDQASSLAIATLLSGLGLTNPEVIHVSASPSLGVSLSNGSITITPEADYNGKGSLVLSILDAGKLSTLVVPLKVIGSADAPVLLRPIKLTMDEDGSLIVPEGLLGSTTVDRDVFGDVKVLNLISTAGNFTITHNSADRTFTIQPGADLNGTFSFDLQVQSSSGTYTLQQAVSLTVKPVDDLPEARGFLTGDLTGQSFLRIQDVVKPGGVGNDPLDRALGLIDGDGDPIAGIRITSYPANGDLRWQATPPQDLSNLGDGIQTFDFTTKPIITLADLAAGRLLYRPDITTSNANRLSDLFTFVIVQQRDGSTVESAPYTFNIGDNQDDEKDVLVSDPATQAANQAYNDSIKRPSVLSSSIQYNKQTDQVSLSIDFDQALTLEGGAARVSLKDQANPTAAPKDLGAIQATDLILSNGNKSLSITYTVPADTEGLLSFDLTSQGNVLCNSQHVSLTGDPDQFAVTVDTLPAVLLNNLQSDPNKGFTVKGPSMLLNLEFSNPMVSNGNATLTYRNPFTNQVSTVTSLRPSTTPLSGQTATASSTVSFDFGALVNDLMLTPGETYTLTLDGTTGLKDPGDNATNPGTLSLDLTIPYPDNDVFKDAELKAKTAGNAGHALKPATFYLSVENAVTQSNQVPVVIPFGQLPKGVTVNAGAYTVSKLFNSLNADSTYNLGIKLIGSDASQVAVNELELLFPRQEIFFDPDKLDQIAALSGYSICRDATDPSLGILRLRLKGPGSLAQGTDQLLNLPFHAFPRSNGSGQRDSAPALILRQVVGTKGGTLLNTSSLSLPELLLNKDNAFVANTPLVALGDDSYTINFNSDPIQGDLFIRSLNGLKSTNPITISTAPSKGTVTLDPGKDLWTYTPTKDLSGSDSFTIRISDTNGNQIDHTVTVTINANTDKHTLITAAQEQALALKLSSSPDSNGDGINDSAQGNIAVLPWRTRSNFQNPNAASTSSLIRMQLPGSGATASNGLSTPNLNQSWEFQKIEVLDRNDASVGGGAPTGVAGSWDPLSFSLTTTGNGTPGQTSRVWIDLSSGNYPLSYFNGYRKYVSTSTIQDYLATGLPLNDLTGKPITTAGWYDFTQRKDANGNPLGQGARLITKNGRIQGIELDLKDNAFGDSDVTVGVIKDPGSFILNPKIALNPGQLSSIVVASTTANGLPELQFLAAPGLSEQFKVYSPGAALNGSGMLSGATLTTGQNYKVEEITIDSDRSAYVIQFLDANASKAGIQSFGSFFQGLATGNSAASADGIYRISLSDNIQLGSFTIKTNQLSQAEYNRLSCFNSLSLQKNNYAYFSALYGYRNTNLPSSGDDVLIGKSTANLAANSRETLNGLAGNDLLNGYGNRFNNSLDFNPLTNPISQFGLYQKDTLIGGVGRDDFQLGDAIGAFYQGDGNQGYAVISDFSADDSLILSGSASDYTITASLTSKQSPVGLAGRALYLGDPNGGGDLVAIIQGSASTNLQLNSSQIQWL